jgi:tetratricopeptide (TPR) repeat protein
MSMAAAKAGLRMAAWELRVLLVAVWEWLQNRDEEAAIVRLALEAADRWDDARFLAALRLAGDLTTWQPGTIIHVAGQLYRAKQTAEAERLFAVALERAPEDPYVLIGYGWHLVARHLPREALAYLERANALRPDDFNTIVLMGRAYHSLGDLENARRCLDLAAGMHLGEDDRPHARLASLASDLGRWQEALDYWREAARRNQDHPGPYWGLGNAMLNLGTYKEAISNLERSQTLGWKEQPDVLSDLARCFLRLGEIARAREYCEKALKAAPDDPDVLEVKKEIDAALGGST